MLEISRCFRWYWEGLDFANMTNKKNMGKWAHECIQNNNITTTNKKKNIVQILWDILWELRSIQEVFLMIIPFRMLEFIWVDTQDMDY